MAYTATVAAGNDTGAIDCTTLAFVPGDDFQGLSDDETRNAVITVLGTDARRATVSTEVSVTVTGSDDNTAPTFQYTPDTLPYASAGSLVLDSSNDLSTWFADAEGDIISFEGSAGYTDGQVTANCETIAVDGGAGDDLIRFAFDAGASRGRITVNRGDGADKIQFSDGAQNLTVDLGAADNAVDTLIFEGYVSNATIANREQGLDIVDVVDPNQWAGIDNGTDPVFTNGRQDITILDVIGVDVDSFLSVEPKVILDLMALAQAGGQVVSRNAIMDAAWDDYDISDEAFPNRRRCQCRCTLSQFSVRSNDP